MVDGEKTDMRKEVEINAFVTLDFIVDRVFRELNREEIMDIILRLDNHVCDFDFTAELVNRLIKTLRIDEPDWTPK